MSKRFTDTDKYKKAFMRSLPGPYKLLWDYLYHDCNHVGIWHKDFEIAQIYLGVDMPVNEQEAIRLFNQNEERIVILNGGSKWFVRPFIEFQYGVLNPENRLHFSVLQGLEKEGIKGLVSPLGGAKDKDKDKDKNKDKESLSLKGGVGGIEIPEDLKDSDLEIKDWLSYKRQKGQTYKGKGLEALWRAFRAIPKEKRRESVDYSMANNWSGLFQKNGGNNGNKANDERSVANDRSGKPSKFAGIEEEICL